MLRGNAIQKAFAKNGIFPSKKKNKRKYFRKIKCKACGTEMIRHEGTNVIACPNCDEKFILTENSR